LEHVLDVFSGFFACPSFPEERVVEEVKAVNSEHQKNLLDDDWRRMRLIEVLANPEHPFSKFSTGDTDTLGGEKDLGLLAKEFKEKFYIAENMKLVIYGNFTDLEDYVTDLFSEIKSGPTSAPSRPVPFLTTGQLAVAPGITDGHSLLLVWTLPSQYDYIATQPLSLIAYMLNSHGDTGLRKRLLSAGYIFNFEAGILDNLKDFSLFQMDLTLTDSGLVHWEECVDVIDAYIQGMLELTESQVNEVWEHFKMVKSAEFDYGTDISVLNVVLQTASNLQHFSPADAYSGFTLQRTFGFSAFRTHLEGMTRDQIIGVLMSKDLQEDSLFMGEVLSLPETEEFYGIKYQVFNISLPGADETSWGLKFPTSVDSGIDDVQLQTCAECNSTPEALVHSESLEFWYQVSLHTVR
jgi:secreted Zn-dependent insulinase-like peptidase